MSLYFFDTLSNIYQIWLLILKFTFKLQSDFKRLASGILETVQTHTESNNAVHEITYLEINEEHNS